MLPAQRLCQRRLCPIVFIYSSNAVATHRGTAIVDIRGGFAKPRAPPGITTPAPAPNHSFGPDCIPTCVDQCSLAHAQGFGPSPGASRQSPWPSQTAIRFAYALVVCECKLRAAWSWHLPPNRHSRTPKPLPSRIAVDRAPSLPLRRLTPKGLAQPNPQVMCGDSSIVPATVTRWRSNHGINAEHLVTCQFRVQRAECENGDPNRPRSVSFF